MGIHSAQHIKDTKIGPAVAAASGAAEAILDTTPLALVSSASEQRVTYPMILEIESAGAAIYVRQGPSTVTLNATAANNARIPDGQFREVVVEGPGDAYFAHERIGGVDSVIRATRLDRVAQ
jgi:hypothetical protein